MCRTHASPLRPSGPRRGRLGFHVLALGLFAGVAAADTDVAGLIDRDTVWSKADAPFVITANVIVGEGATLTIEPGVVVQLENLRSLIIGDQDFGPGTLIARGTPEEPIRFEGAGFDPGPGSWRRIRFDELAVSATFDGPDGPYLHGSVMQHCEIRHGGGGSTPGNGLTMTLRSSPWIQAVDVRDSLGRGIAASLDGAPPIRIEDCTVFGLDGGGISVFGGEGHLVSNCVVQQCEASFGAGLRVGAVGIRLIKNRILNNAAEDRGGGIWIEESEGALVEGNFVAGNVAESGGGLWIDDSDGIVVRGNTIRDNSVSVLGGGFFAGDGSAFEDNIVLDNEADEGGGFFIGGDVWSLTGNLFAGNRARTGDGGGGLASGGSSNGERFITGNRFEGNRADAGDGGGLHTEVFGAVFSGNHFQSNVAVRGAGCFVTFQVVSFQEDVFTRNRAATLGGGLFVEADDVVATDVRLIENTAGEAGGGAHWEGLGGSVASSGDGRPGAPATEIRGNEAPVGAAIRVRGPFAENGLWFLDASFVDWGTDDVDEIETRIDDFFDDPTRPLVVTTPLQPGLIVDDVTWTREEGPYVVEGSLIVGRGATLTIEPGTEIRMPPQSRILVGILAFGAGAVVAQGTDADPILFTAATPSDRRSPGDWGGIIFRRNTVDAFFDSDGVYFAGSILEHCIVEFAGGGETTRGAITITQSRPHLVDSVIRDSAQNGVFGDPDVDRVRIRRTRFERCHGSVPGGGVHLRSGADHEIEGCTFIDCRGPQGGGLFVDGPGARIIGNQFIDNLAEGSDEEPAIGGGLFLRSQTGRVQDNVFTGNVAEVGGGLASSEGFFLRIEDNTLLGNIAVAGGGMNVASTNTFVRRNLFISNTASDAGGGLRATASGIRLGQNRFQRNVAETGDGGGAAIASPNAEIEANDFHGNVAGGAGGGAWIASGGGEVLDIIAIGNTAAVGGGVAIATGAQPIVVRRGRVRDNTALSRGGGFAIDGTDVRLEEVTVLANTAGDGGGLHWTGGGIIASDARFPMTIVDNLAETGAQLTFVAPAGQTLPATNVCWGTDDEIVIEAGITDGGDGTGGGVVEFLPFLPAATCVRPSCPADLSADALVDLTDLLIVLQAFETTGEADVTGDGIVDFDDVIAVLAEWGRCP